MEEKLIKSMKGMGAFIFFIGFLFVDIVLIILSIQHNSHKLLTLSILLLIFDLFLPFGIKVVKPNEALVLTLFGHYTGTIKEAGIYFVNPFSVAVNPASHTQLRQSGDVHSTSTSISIDGTTTTNVTPSKKAIFLKKMTLSNGRQKINDVLGNPIEIAVAVIWQVKDTAKAVFEVDNYKEYLSLQCDAALRNIVRIYLYDVAENIDTTGDSEPDDGSLRGSSTLVAERIRQEIQDKVADAGL